MDESGGKDRDGQRNPGLPDVLRTVLGLSAIFPPLLTGLCVLVVTRNRRRAVNHVMGFWAWLSPRAIGLRLDVRGGEILAQARPAIFLINHRSGVDPLILAALLRRDFVAIAKKELQHNPVFGPAFAFAGTVFIDRDKPDADALAPAVAALRSGLSIALAPEGTRARPGVVLGTFRSGAFRMAILAQVPIVPIVIHNAEDALPGRARVMTPALVRVEVLPPVSPQDWSTDRLEEHVATVRDMYLQALANQAAAGS